MHLKPAVESEFAAIVHLANLAYRGTGTEASWNAEAGILEGQRLNEAQLRDDLAAKPEAHMLTYKDEPNGPLLGTVWLEPQAQGVWYLGLLTVRPDLQKRQLGRSLLAEAEAFARENGALQMRMSVLNVRGALIAWYVRRGYLASGETQAFPYGDDRFGKPLRDDLAFVILEKSLDDEPAIRLS